MKDEEFGFLKDIKLKNRSRGKGQIIQTFCRIGSPQKVAATSLICRNLKDLRKVLLIHAECIKIEKNDKEFGFMKVLKLKYRWGDQIIQTFCKIVSPEKLGPPSLISRNFKTLRKVILNHRECMKI